MISTATSAEIIVSGVEIASGTVTETCPHDDVTLDIKAVGAVFGFKWKYPDGTEVSSRKITIPDFTGDDVGTYTASYNSGGCSWESSITLNLKPSKPEFTYDNSFIVCLPNSLNLSMLSPSGGSVSDLTMSYWNVDYSQNVTSMAHAIQTTGIYNIVGTNQYGCSDSSSVKVSVPPVTTTWTAQGNPNDWNDEKNWDNGVPAYCSDVVIPDQSTFSGVGSPHYPILQPSDGTYPQAECDTILFKFGGEVARTNYLKYNFAKVDLTLDANRWYTLAPALQQQYSGDYQEHLSQYRLNPEIYIMYYQTSNPQTQMAKVASKFTGFFNNTDELLKITSGHAIWVDNGSRLETKFTIHFPKDSVQYAYYDQFNRVSRFSGIMPRNNKGRFIYEQNPDYTGEGFSRVIENTESFPQVIIGNPFMSHLDVVKFQEVNRSYLDKAYRIWKGNMYESYLIDSSGSIIATDGGEDGYLIPPMQSFIINSRLLFSDPIQFTPEMSITQPGKILRSTGNSDDRMAPDVLLLEVLKGEVRQSGLAIHYKAGATRCYSKDKDVWTIIPQSVGNYISLFAMVDGNAASIHTIGDLDAPIDLNIAVGNSIKKVITSGGKETYAIQIHGDEVHLMGMDVYLRDDKIGVEHNLSQSAYEFDNKTGDISGRFRLFFKDRIITTGLDEISSKDNLQINYSDGRVNVAASYGNAIRAISVFNIIGQPLYSIDNLDELNWSFGLSPENQVVIVKVRTVTGTKMHKIILK